MHVRISGLLILTYLLLFISSFTFAQNDQICGAIFDANTKTGLVGASIHIKGTQRGTISNHLGEFCIKDLVEKQIVLEISFIGYQSQELAVNVDKVSQKQLKVFLNPNDTELGEVKIHGETKGTVRAQLIQKEAENIKNVVSAEQIKQFPDINAAEVIQRIPGITIQRDQGEGRFVQLRGTPPELTNFNVNGEQIPSPEGNVRYVGMDIIAADQIDFIEVTKVLTPDMDADGIAGNINIITKSANSEKPEISAYLSGGYNDLMKSANSLLQFSYGQLNHKIGYQLNAVSSVVNQGSHNMEFDYTRGPVLGQANDTTGEENFHVLYSDIEYRHYSIQRKKTGLSGSLEYHPNKESVLYLRGMYNRFSDEELRRRVTHKLTDANTPLIYRSASMERDVRFRNKIQEISTLNLGGKNRIRGLLDLDYEVSYAMATDEIPDYFTAEFSQNLIGITLDRSDIEWPVVNYSEPQDSINAFNYGAYKFGGLSIRENLVTDQNYTARFNLSIPYSIGKSQSGTIKFGAKARLKEKIRDNNAWVYSKYDKINIYAHSFIPLTFPAVVDDFEEQNLLNHNYILSMTPSYDSMQQFYMANRQYFKYDEPSSWENTYQEDYQARENIYAAYVMAKHQINNLMILGGLRYELNLFDYTTQNAWLDLEIGSPTRGQLLKNDSTRVRSIPFLLPQIQLKYLVNDKVNVRAAITHSYTRPGFESLLPYRIVNEDGDIKKGNPNLLFPTSWNADLLYETFLPYSGLISGGLFYKKIDHFVFQFVRKAHEGSNFSLYGLKEITMPVNGQEAFVYGLELQSQFKFYFLDGIWKNFGFYGTYTFTESSAYISKRYPQNEKDIIYEYDDYSSNFFTSSGEQ